jgi:hypothetical protein
MEPKNKLFEFSWAVNHPEKEEFAAANLILMMPGGRAVSGMAFGRNLNRAMAYALRDLANDILSKCPETAPPLYAEEIVV